MPIGDWNEATLQAFVEKIVGPVHGLRMLLTMVVVGNGAPAGAPRAARAVYIRLDGGAGSTFYVWNGGAWTAVA